VVNLPIERLYQNRTARI